MQVLSFLINGPISQDRALSLKTSNVRKLPRFKEHSATKRHHEFSGAFPNNDAIYHNHVKICFKVLNIHV